ncbi:hypothetical protein LguiA_017699 [Lonicera macranthoides]
MAVRDQVDEDEIDALLDKLDKGEKARGKDGVSINLVTSALTHVPTGPLVAHSLIFLSGTHRVLGRGRRAGPSSS